MQGYVVLHKYTSYPRQCISAGIFQCCQVCRAEKFFKNNIGRLWIHYKVKLSTHLHISCSCKDKINLYKPTCFKNTYCNNVVVLPSILPPIMYRSLSFLGKHGSSLTASARLVSGPRATRETCRKHILAAQHQRAAAHNKQSTERFLTCFWFSVTSLIIALTACSFWIFSSHCGSLSSVTSPSPSVPKWSLSVSLASTRGPPAPRNTGICRKKKRSVQFSVGFVDRLAGKNYNA